MAPTTRMRKNAGFIVTYRNAKTNKEKKGILKKCGSKEICTLSEISKNLKAGKFKLSPQQKAFFKRNRAKIRMLASRKVSFKKKKKRIMKGGFLALTSALLGIAYPLIKGIYDHYKSKKKS